ncbi:Rossmann-like alpha/beta/alpha sandwich fold protein [Raphanus sativus]|nr:Rossmann-like alpha/beta/alpha sandwich fold protein [Raphanus sativus]
MKQSLAHLSQSLKALESHLTLIKTHNTISAILDCVRATDPVSLVRDHTVKEKLVERGVSVQSYNGDLLFITPPAQYRSPQRGFMAKQREKIEQKQAHMEEDRSNDLRGWTLGLET